MLFFQPFSIAVKSMLRNKGRSFLTMLGIIIGVSAVVILVSIMQHATGQVKREMELLGTNRITINYYDTLDISRELQNFIIERDDLFEGFTPSAQTWLKIKYKSKSSDMSIFFGSDKYGVCNNYSITSGVMFTKEHVDSRSRVAVIGSAAKKNLFNYVDPIGKAIKIGGEDYTVIGVFEEKYEYSEYSMDNFVVVPYSRQRSIMKTNKIDSFTVKARSSETTEQAIVELNDFLKEKLKTEWKYYVYSMNEAVNQVNEVTGMLSLVLGGIAGISLLVGGIGIMNIMLVSVSERTREIGIRRAIGAKRGDIVWQFLIEAGTVSMLGGLGGMLFGSFVTLVLGKIIFDEIVLPSILLMLGAVAFSAAIGIFFGFYPSFRASKLNPIDALRAE